jgi:hypothetical protein
MADHITSENALTVSLITVMYTYGYEYGGHGLHKMLPNTSAGESRRVVHGLGQFMGCVANKYFILL